jgi:hypothetical protein
MDPFDYVTCNWWWWRYVWYAIGALMIVTIFGQQYVIKTLERRLASLSPAPGQSAGRPASR